MASFMAKLRKTSWRTYYNWYNMVQLPKKSNWPFGTPKQNFIVFQPSIFKCERLLVLCNFGKKGKPSDPKWYYWFGSGNLTLIPFLSWCRQTTLEHIPSSRNLSSRHPRKLTDFEPKVMEVWFRWFSGFQLGDVYSMLCMFHVDFPGCE